MLSCSVNIVLRLQLWATVGDGCDVPEMQARSRAKFTVNYIITAILRTVKIPALPRNI